MDIWKFADFLFKLLILVIILVLAIGFLRYVNVQDQLVRNILIELKGA